MQRYHGKLQKNFEYGGSVVPASAAITRKNKLLEIFNLTTGRKCGIVYSVS